MITIRNGKVFAERRPRHTIFQLPTTQINLSDFQIQYRATSIHDLQFGNQIVYILYLPSPTSILMYFVNIEFFPLC